MKRQRRKEGNLYQIDLGDGTHVYAREATFSSVAIHDSRTTLDLPIDEAVKLPILFFVAVMNQAITQGRWKIVGHRSFADAPLPHVPPKFISDIADKGQFSLYFNDGQIRRATREEIKGLEPASVWFPEHVERRLLDYYEGHPNQWKESLGIPKECWP